MKTNPCARCGFWDGDLCSCTCPHSDKWYACPIESEKPENQQALKEYADWLPQYEGRWATESEDT